MEALQISQLKTVRRGDRLCFSLIELMTTKEKK
jgi:hypothetical protein